MRSQAGEPSSTSCKSERERERDEGETREGGRERVGGWMLQSILDLTHDWFSLLFLFANERNERMVSWLAANARAEPRTGLSSSP